MFRRLEDIRREHFPNYHKWPKKKTKHRKINKNKNIGIVKKIIEKIKRMIKRYL